MNFLDIVKRDLCFYRRTQIVMGLLASVCCVVLTGALLVGDSVQHSLLSISDMRLGNIELAMTTGDCFFRQELAGEVGADTDSLVTPVLAVKGVLESPDGSMRVNGINVYGVSANFWKLAPRSDASISFDSVDGMLISQSVASRLGQHTSDLLLRIQPLSQVSQDLIYSEGQSSSRAWSAKIAGIIPDEMLGRFDLLASQAPPLNIFVPIDWLAEKVGVEGKANLLLVGLDEKNPSTIQNMSAVLKEAINPQDLELDIRIVAAENAFELRTSRIFLDDSVVDAALMTGQDPYGIFTSFVNEIRWGDKTVPYSTISGIGGKVGHSLLAGLKDEQIILNEWLADELKADEGDLIQLTYFQITPTRRLVEETASFVVKQVVPVMGTFADPTLMPDYPGLTEADSCSDWDSGIPIDLDRIEQRDEDYWDKYKGTPKAFVSLRTAQAIWKNRFGTLTAVRWPKASNSKEQISSGLMKNLDPGHIGFAFRNVRQTAHQSAVGSTNFARLFAGLSIFLIFSAALLLALMFVFYVESRTEQVGLLLAVGWSRLKIFSLFLAEGASVACVGCVVGAVVSVLYTAGLIVVLNVSFWAKALASLQLSFHMTPATLLKGFFISLLICVFAILLSLLRRVRRPVHQLLTGIFEEYSNAKRYGSLFLSALGLVCLVTGILISASSMPGQAQVAMFFIAGTLCLAGFILSVAGSFKWLRFNSGSFVHSLKLLAIKSIPRKTGRSLAVSITLACGVFMIVGVGANYKEIGSTAHHRSSGTGGFSLLVRTTLPLTKPLELTKHDPAIDANAFVPMRIYQQDDASCLNLNRAQQPTLLGVQPEKLAQRNAFSFQRVLSETAGLSPWQLLDHQPDDGTIPAVGDYATVFWGLGKKLGETISYQAETGDTIQLKIAGILKDSLLQGRLLISEENMVRFFPSADGYRQFLIDGAWDRHQQQAEALMKQYRDFGMEVISARQKLAQYHEVENTYLAIFLVLGGLGVVLGSAALGLVLVLNVLDRQGELAMMQAVGFKKRSLSRMLLLEHSVLLLVGLLCGLIPALWAVLPSISAQGNSFPYVKIVLIAVAIVVNGVVWTRIAVVRLLKTDVLQILRNE